MISHIVLFEPKAGLTEETIRLFARQLENVVRAVPAVRRARVGRRIDVDVGHQRNFGDNTYSFSAVLEFDDQGGLLKYLTDPQHLELGRMFWETCARTVVLEVTSVDALREGVADFLVNSQS